MAKGRRAELVIVHVLSVVVLPISGEAYVSPRVYDEVSTAMHASARKQLDALVRKARKAGVRARSLLLEGVAHERILRAARSQRAGVIVMGTHGRSGLARLFLGSVAQRVVTLATCPVITVRGR
jgi:nucleotide-binding universal stress UspA family protein